MYTLFAFFVTFVAFLQTMVKLDFNFFFYGPRVVGAVGKVCLLRAIGGWDVLKLRP